MDKYIYGADTESVEGEPLSLQFYSQDCRCDSLYFVNAKTAAKKFFEWCGRRARNVQHVVYVHGLDFDLIEFLWGHHTQLVGIGGEFSFSVGEWQLAGVYGTPTFCRVSNGHNCCIYFINSLSFFRGSLAKAAELFCPDLPKLCRPKELGKKRFTSRDTHFCEYAMRDAEVAFHMGKWIEKLHQEFDLQQCVSVADMAARIFRHKFLTYTIPQPTRDIIETALLSYHGGKNNITVPAGWYTNVKALDISSAYPHAMAQFPAFSDDALYRKFQFKGAIHGPPRNIVPPYGVYRVSGRADQCKWPSIYSHSFKPLHGRIEDVCVQGFEINEAFCAGELHPSKIVGWYYDAERDHEQPALRAFVRDFYARKEQEKNPILRYMYKLILNSISGKFIQTRKIRSVAYVDINAGTITQASELVAGGMFHPFIASAITSHTRARIHGLEHQYNALHTATDGFFTQYSSAASRRTKSLGSLTLEASGELLLIRNKLYILYSSHKADAQHPKSQAFAGKRIEKYALHGFQGSVHDLEKLVATGRRKYIVNRPHRLREALKRRLTPNQFVERTYTLKVGEIPVR